jgi:hypothetical protein
LVGVAIGLDVASLGALVGTVVERMRFDFRRDAAVARYDAALRVPRFPPTLATAPAEPWRCS